MLLGSNSEFLILPAERQTKGYVIAERILMWEHAGQK
jgi:hypothetical protein